MRQAFGKRMHSYTTACPTGLWKSRRMFLRAITLSRRRLQLHDLCGTHIIMTAKASRLGYFGLSAFLERWRCCEFFQISPSSSFIFGSGIRAPKPLLNFTSIGHSSASPAVLIIVMGAVVGRVAGRVFLDTALFFLCTLTLSPGCRVFGDRWFQGRKPRAYRVTIITMKRDSRSIESRPIRLL